MSSSHFDVSCRRKSYGHHKISEDLDETSESEESFTVVSSAVESSYLPGKEVSDS
jgi:hypothetical protein